MNNKNEQKCIEMKVNSWEILGLNIEPETHLYRGSFTTFIGLDISQNAKKNRLNLYLSSS